MSEYDDVVFVRELLVEANKEFRQALGNIKDALKTLDYPQITFGSHAIKGASASIMCMRLSRCAEILETCSKSKNKKKRKEDVTTILVRKLEKCVEELENFDLAI